jgi:hypothetical protein
MVKNKTIFCDIDGTIFEYRKFETYTSSTPTPIEDVVEKIKEWFDNGEQIILTTARPEYMRYRTMEELNMFNIPYTTLLMGIGRGPRYVINDMDPNKPGKRATGINLKRNEGFKDINLSVYSL